jgi:hypothetical protein
MIPIANILGSVGIDKIITALGDTVDRFVTTNEDREKMKMEVMNAVNAYNVDIAKQGLADTANARDMYKADNWLQKIYALVFLLGYILLTGVMLWFIYSFATSTSNKLPEWAIAFVSTLFGAMSAKVSTITDFLFGSSQGSRQKDNKELTLNQNQNG